MSLFLLLSFPLYQLINLRAATEVSSLPSTNQKARQGGRSREKRFTRGGNDDDSESGGQKKNHNNK